MTPRHPSTPPQMRATSICPSPLGEMELNPLLYYILSTENSDLGLLGSRKIRVRMPGNSFQFCVYPFWGLDSIVIGFPSWAFWGECGIGEMFLPSRDASVLGEPRLGCAGRLPGVQSCDLVCQQGPEFRRRNVVLWPEIGFYLPSRTHKLLSLGLFWLLSHAPPAISSPSPSHVPVNGVWPDAWVQSGS